MARPPLTEAQHAMLAKLGSNVAAHRAEAGLTQEQLAELIGADRQYVHRVERGKTNVSATRIIEFSYALNAPLDGLLKDT